MGIVHSSNCWHKQPDQTVRQKKYSYLYIYKPNPNPKYIYINLKTNNPIFTSTEVLPLFYSSNSLNSSNKKVICFVLQLKSAKVMGTAAHVKAHRHSTAFKHLQPKRCKSDQIHPKCSNTSQYPTQCVHGQVLFTLVIAGTNSQNKTVRQKKYFY